MDEKENTLLAEEETLKSVQGSEYAVNSAIEEKKSESYRKIPHGKATDAIAFAIRIEPEINEISNKGTLTANKVKIEISDFNTLKRSFAVSTHKLLLEAIRRFSEENHIGDAGNARSIYPVVYIPLEEYALLCGYDVIKHPKNTTAEADEEAKRVENTLREVRRKVKDDLKILYEGSLSWEEIIKGEPESFDDCRILGRKSFTKNGLIRVEFTYSFAEYLTKLPFSQYPAALWKLDERKTNAYVIGLQMVMHFNMYNNQIRKTAQFLKVRTLLGYTTLPAIEELREKGRSWQDRIKKPFETALDALKEYGVLENWEYSHPEGVLTESEETFFATYEEWEKTLLHFTLKDAPDHTSRIRAIEEEKKQNQQSPKRMSKKTKKQKKEQV